MSEKEFMRDFTESVAMEAVRILDLLCLMDPPLITRIFPAVKKVRNYSTIASKAAEAGGILLKHPASDACLRCVLLASKRGGSFFFSDEREPGAVGEPCSSLSLVAGLAVIVCNSIDLEGLG